MRCQARWLAVFLVGLAIVAGCDPCCEAQGAAVDLRAVCHAATCRVRVGNSMGSGTVFRATEDAFYVLTNAHVTGSRINGKASCEFWFAGHQSEEIPGVIVAVAYIPRGSRDVAVIRVARAALGGYAPPVIDLLPRGTPAEYSRIYSVGCAGGRWPTSFEGFGFAIDSAGQTVRFKPTPAGGRSGSAIFATQNGEPKIVGLLTWRSTDGGGHDMDGRGERSGHGIAQTSEEIWAALMGESSRGGGDGYGALVEPDGMRWTQVQRRPNQPQLVPVPLPTPLTRRSPHPEGQPTPADPTTNPGTKAAKGEELEIPDTGKEGDVVLLYSDPVAVGPDPTPSPAQVYDCPNGQCPNPNQMQPQKPPEPGPEQGIGRLLFPSLPQVPQVPPSNPAPTPQQSEPETTPPPEPEPGSGWPKTPMQWIPWILVGLWLASYVVRAMGWGTGAILDSLAAALRNRGGPVQSAPVDPSPPKT